MNTILKKAQQKASYFIIAMIMWEFFAFYGLKSILMLYLVKQLHLSDTAAYQLFGSFISLMFITPIFGGWLADRYCGYRYATAVGCILIILGSFMLATCPHNVFIGLSLLTMGIGFFKSNAVCLISNCYVNDSVGAASAFSLYYVSGNLGSILSQVVCPYLVEHVSWRMGFLVATFGMIAGFLMLLFSKPHFSWEEKTAKMKDWEHLSSIKKTATTIVICSLVFLITYILLRCDWVIYVLIAAVIIATGVFIKIHRDADPVRKKALFVLAIMTCFATSFWIFSNQVYSSYPLFISRYVDRNIMGSIIPTGMFQGFNPISVLFAGLVMTFVWRWMGRLNIRPQSDCKLAIALLLLVLGFFVITYATTLANLYSPISMLFPILSIFLLGMAEIFVDPVLLAAIGDVAPHNTEGRLVATYYLFCQAVGNYLSIWVSKLTVDPTTSQSTPMSFHAAYLRASYIAVVLLGLLLVRILWRKWSTRHIKLAF